MKSTRENDNARTFCVRSCQFYCIFIRFSATISKERFLVITSDRNNFVQFLCQGNIALVSDNVEHAVEIAVSLCLDCSDKFRMAVADIENATFAEPQAWTANRKEDIRKVSVHNITSLSAEELVEYVKGTTLFNTMLAELEARGVNTENIMELYTKDAAFSA